MPNIFAKSLLLATALSPVLLVLAVSELEETGKPLVPFSLALLAVIACWTCHAMLTKVRATQAHRINVTKVERRDQEVLTFLFIYLLPFIRGSSLALDHPWTLLSVGAVVFSALIAANAFHFNPTMWLFRYRFYSVEDRNRNSVTLISKQQLRPGNVVRAHQLASRVYLLKEH